jgi:branched-chain amino acid:cation transporter, LIVCS family
MNTSSFKTIIFPAGLAIFSMFFGAGNLMLPIKTGAMSGTNNFYGTLGFVITAVLIPLSGLIAMILFNGDYKAFFARLGNIPGKLMLAGCMIVIGPLIAIPRIVTVGHLMIAPFLPAPFQQPTPFTLLMFGIVFLGITFLATYKENKIVDLLGWIISPLLILSLAILVIVGIIKAGPAVPASGSAFTVFKKNLIYGYGTLDLIGALFFTSIVLGLLKSKVDTACANNMKKLALVGLKAGAIGVGLLALVYIGQSFLGAHYGIGIEGMNEGMNEGEAFRAIIFKVIGSWGAIIVGSASIFACLSTSIAIGAVVAEYVQKDILGNRISFSWALAITLLICLPLSVYGLDTILRLTGGPITYVGYPALIALTFCNIAYKLFNFKPTKLPVALTFIIATIAYFW